MKKVLITLVATSVFMFTPAFAAKDKIDGCKEADVVGSYVNVSPQEQEVSDGSIRNVTYLFQLSLNAGGTVSQNFTGKGDFMVTGGTDATAYGSWTCRADGTLLLSTIYAIYHATTYNPFSDQTVSDIELNSHIRHNRVFSVDDPNTITMRQSMYWYYQPNEDPTDLSGGWQSDEAFPDIEYTRLVPSDFGLTPTP